MERTSSERGRRDMSLCNVETETVRAVTSHRCHLKANGSEPPDAEQPQWGGCSIKKKHILAAFYSLVT